MLVDPLEECVAYKDKVSTYISSSQEISEIAKQLIYEVDRRLEKDLYSDWLIMMPTIKAIVDQGLTEKDLRYLFDNGPRVGMHFVIGSEYSYLGNNINEVPKYLKGNAQWFMIGMRLMDQMFLDKPYNIEKRVLLQMKSTCMIASKLLNLKSLRMDREVTI